MSILSTRRLIASITLALLSMRFRRLVGPKLGDRYRCRGKAKQGSSMQHPGRAQILHLGFEDFRRPGNGGGSIRTHEMNRRLAAHYEITVLVAQFKGSVDRVEDGVRYIHIGRPWGYFGSIITYFVAVPFQIRRHEARLVVEDFAAPVSSCLSPLWSRKPHLAMVQWLNAKHKSKQYHLPFWLIESLGLWLHTNYIAVSRELADTIAARRSGAIVDVIANGVPPMAFGESLGKVRKDIVFLGRVEREQKGLDLLLDAYSRVAPHTSDDLLLIGDGPDEQWARSRVCELNLGERVQMLGRIEGAEKVAILSRAGVVAMPSRFETFGMVAVEAFAAGAAVVCFDIDCLREVVPEVLGDRVTPFDIDGYAEALLRRLSTDSDTDLGTAWQVESRRRNFALDYDWDVLANRQKLVYDRFTRLHDDSCDSHNSGPR